MTEKRTRREWRDVTPPDDDGPQQADTSTPGTIWYILTGLALGLAILSLALILLGQGQAEDDIASRSFSTNIYSTDGGDRMVVASGGQIEFESGGRLELESGSTLSVTGESVVPSGAELEIQSGGTLSVADGALTLDNLAFTGPVVFGSGSNVISGTRLAHGVGTTPTAVVISPLKNGDLTQAVYLQALNATSFTVGIEAGTVTQTTVYYMAGK